jgi:hypothetical protein
VLLPASTNGAFEKQEVFLKYILENQNCRWKTEFTSRPTSEGEPDFSDDSIRDTFSLQFPYGQAGL